MPRLLEPSRPGADRAAAMAGVDMLDPPPFPPPAEGVTVPGACKGTVRLDADMTDERKKTSRVFPNRRSWTQDPIPDSDAEDYWQQSSHRGSTVSQLCAYTLA